MFVLNSLGSNPGEVGGEATALLRKVPLCEEMPDDVKLPANTGTELGGPLLRDSTVFDSW